MSGSSTVAGYLLDAGGGNAAGRDALDDLLGDVVAGVTGLDRTLVRPRWQPTTATTNSPTQPPAENDWVAVGVVRRRADANPYVRHSPSTDADPGYDETQRHEVLEVLVSCYGPDAADLASALRDALEGEAQNRDALRAAGLDLRSVGEVVAVPELVNGQRWLYRADVRLTVARNVVRRYNVTDLVSAGGTVASDAGTTTPFATPPLP